MRIDRGDAADDNAIERRRDRVPLFDLQPRHRQQMRKRLAAQGGIDEAA